MKKWIFNISIFLNAIFIIVFTLNWLNTPSKELGRLEKDIEIVDSQSDSVLFQIPQGTFTYELYFAEFGGRMPNSECIVIIKGNEITIEQTENTHVSGGKEIFKGFIFKHKSGKWILADESTDLNADEIGGCTEIPIIKFDQKLIEWC